MLSAAEIASTLLGADRLAEAVTTCLYGVAGPSALRPGPLADAIAALQDVCGGDMEVATFNYDELIEDAMRERRGTWWSTVSPRVRPRKPRGLTVDVIHLHGLLGRTDRERIVLTEADYQIMQNRTSWQQEWFVERLRTTTCLFLGVGMSDPNLIRYLHRAPRSRRSHYALLRRDVIDPANPDFATARAHSEEAERLRWKKLGVKVLFADNYADIAQFAWELFSLIDAPTDYRSLPERLRLWWSAEEARGCLFGRTERGYRALQSDLHDALREMQDDILALLRTESPTLATETLASSLWALSPPATKGGQERVQILAHTDRIMTSPGTRETIELNPASKWTGVNCICLGRPQHDAKDVYASRWKYVVGIPIFRDSPRTLLGALTLSTMSPQAETALASLSAPALRSLTNLVQGAGERWLTLAG